MRYLFITFLLLFFHFSCKTPEYFAVERVNKDEVNSHHKLYYALPATKIKITVVQEKFSVTPGEYCQFAMQFFGVPAERSAAKVSYQMKQIVVEDHVYLDSSRIFSLSFTEHLPMGLTLNSNGYISGINLTENKQMENCTEHNQSFCLYKNKAEKTVVIPDYPKEFFQFGTKQAKAEYIAAKVYSLRDDRQYLSIGEATNAVLPDGEALKIMMNYLQQMENKYLELFYGSEKKELDTFVFWSTPKDIAFQHELLFRFAPETGIADVTNVNALPVYLDVETKNIEQIARLEERTKIIRWKAEMPGGLVYVIPSESTITLRNDNEILSQKVLQISQLGKLGVLPISLLNPNTTIEFYPCKGTLKLIKPNYINEK